MNDVAAEFAASIAAQVIDEFQARWQSLRVACDEFSAGRWCERRVLIYARAMERVYGAGVIFGVDVLTAFQQRPFSEREHVFDVLRTCRTLVTLGKAMGWPAKVV